MDKYLQINNSVFVDKGFYLYCLFPENINVKTINLLQKHQNKLFIRYISDFDMINSGEWYYIIKDKHEDLNEYSSNTRKLIRRGLKNFEYRLIDIHLYLEEAYNIYVESSKYYGNKISNYSNFYNQIMSETSSSYINIDFYGAFCENKLVGYCKNFISDSTVFYESLFVLPPLLKNYINYGFFHEMNTYYLNEHNYRFVTNGSKNIHHETNIQDFLIEKFHYRKAFCKLHIIYNIYGKILIAFLRFIMLRLHINISKLNALLKQDTLREKVE